MLIIYYVDSPERVASTQVCCCMLKFTLLSYWSVRLICQKKNTELKYSSLSAPKGRYRSFQDGRHGSKMAATTSDDPVTRSGVSQRIGSLGKYSLFQGTGQQWTEWSRNGSINRPVTQSHFKMTAIAPRWPPRPPTTR